jgi:hypothetical protein
VAREARQTFVVELPGPLSLAFTAADEAEGLALSKAPWFAEALSKYLRSKSSGLTTYPLIQIRPATKEETSVYRDYAREFAELSDCFLFAPV